MSSLWSWLIKQGIVIRVLDALLAHGLVVVLLVTILVYTEMQRHRTAAELTREIQDTRIEVGACQDEILRLYREDRREMLQALDRNTAVMEKVYIAIER